MNVIITNQFNATLSHTTSVLDLGRRWPCEESVQSPSFSDRASSRLLCWVPRDNMKPLTNRWNCTNDRWMCQQDQQRKWDIVHHVSPFPREVLSLKLFSCFCFSLADAVPYRFHQGRYLFPPAAETHSAYLSHLGLIFIFWKQKPTFGFQNWDEVDLCF